MLYPNIHEKVTIKPLIATVGNSIIHRALNARIGITEREAHNLRQAALAFNTGAGPLFDTVVKIPHILTRRRSEIPESIGRRAARHKQSNPQEANDPGKFLLIHVTSP